MNISPPHQMDQLFLSTWAGISKRTALFNAHDKANPGSNQEQARGRPLKTSSKQLIIAQVYSDYFLDEGILALEEIIPQDFHKLKLDF